MSIIEDLMEAYLHLDCAHALQADHTHVEVGRKTRVACIACGLPGDVREWHSYDYAFVGNSELVDTYYLTH